MPGPIRSIGDLPFRCRPAAELLGLTHDLGAIDVDYTGFGWTRVDRVWLDDGREVHGVDDALVLALHAADGAGAVPADLDLEFVLEPADGGGGSVIVRASDFLERWLPRLPPAAAIVLAMCNPHRVLLPVPPAAGATPLFHGLGDVDSWLDSTATGDRLRLRADGWRRSPAEA